MFSSIFVVPLFAKRTQQIFTKFYGKVTHGPRKKESRFCWYSGSRYVRVRDRVRLGLRLAGAER